MTVQWSTAAQGMKLEFSELLDGLASWASVTNLPTVAEFKFTVEMPTADRQGFFAWYRLAFSDFTFPPGLQQQLSVRDSRVFPSPSAAIVQVPIFT